VRGFGLVPRLLFDTDQQQTRFAAIWFETKDFNVFFLAPLCLREVNATVTRARLVLCVSLASCCQRKAVQSAAAFAAR
jgi:hypothetical protein